MLEHSGSVLESHKSAADHHGKVRLNEIHVMDRILRYGDNFSYPTFNDVRSLPAYMKLHILLQIYLFANTYRNISRATSLSLAYLRLITTRAHFSFSIVTSRIKMPRRANQDGPGGKRRHTSTGYWYLNGIQISYMETTRRQPHYTPFQSMIDTSGAFAYSCGLAYPKYIPNGQGDYLSDRDWQSIRPSTAPRYGTQPLGVYGVTDRSDYDWSWSHWDSTGYQPPNRENARPENPKPKNFKPKNAKPKTIHDVHKSRPKLNTRYELRSNTLQGDELQRNSQGSASQADCTHANVDIFDSQPIHCIIDSPFCEAKKWFE